MNGMLSEDSLYLIDIFLKVWRLYFLKYVLFYISKGLSGSFISLHGCVYFVP